MTDNRIYSFDQNAWFIGVVKFFDEKKDFGFIASNNYGMNMATYEQDFWVSSDCFSDTSAKREGAIVAFQYQLQKGGKRRAINVRRFTNKSEEDCALVANYFNSHETVRLKDRDVNLISSCGVPRKFLLPKLKESITSNTNRTPESTLRIFKQFIDKYKLILPPNNWRYIFSKDFDSDLKNLWIEIFDTLAADEWVAILNQFPPAAIYADNATLSCWLDQLQPRINDRTACDDFKYTLPLLNENQQKIYAEKWKLAAEADFLEKLETFKKNGAIPRSRITNTDDLFEAQLKLSKFSDCKFETEINECLGSIKISSFHSALDSFSRQPDSYRKEKLKKCFEKLSDPSEHLDEFMGAFTPLVQKSIDSKNITDTINLLKFGAGFNERIAIPYLESLKPAIEEALQHDLAESLTNGSAYSFENTFESHYRFYTSIFDEDFKTSLKELFTPQILESKSVYLLLHAADSEDHWLEEETALRLATGIVNGWTLDAIKIELHDEYLVEEIDSRIAPAIFKRTLKLLPNGKLENPNLYFLKRIKHLHQDESCAIAWNNFLASLSADDLITLYNNDITNTLPINAIEKILRGLSLSDTFSDPCQWYSAPAFKDEEIKKILSNPDFDIFSIITEIFRTASINKEDIPIYVWLAELLSYNKPPELEYFEEKNWNANFEQRLTSFRNSLPEDSLAIPIIWAVYMKTRCTEKMLAGIFPLLPPYLQIRVVKRFFSFMSAGKMKHTAKSLCEMLSGREERPCLAVEILFSYLSMREENPAANFNNVHMLRLINGRNDHSEWIGIRKFVEECQGRWLINKNDDSIGQNTNKFYNGFVCKADNSTDICLCLTQKMIDKYGDTQKYNNKYFNKIKELIHLNFSQSDYKEQANGDLVKYFFKKECLKDLIFLIRPFNIKNPYFPRNFFSLSNKDEEHFCECRLADELSRNEGLPFYWCSNKPCFRPGVRFHSDDEWMDYTVLDFLRILNIPIDYTGKRGKTIKNGYFIFFSGALKSFAKFYEHLKCRKCGQLLRPVDITNFAKQSITEFECANESCEMRGQTIYLNNCFNKQKCGAIIDSRDSAQCPNGQYICPDCGACCSTENFKLRISNLCETGGYISPRLISFVNNSLGHWEKGEFYCYNCGHKMGEGKVCPNCGSTYKKSKPQNNAPSPSNPDELPF